MKKLQLAFSPCPNDTFMFDAMIHGKIDTEGLEFEVVLEDVETLNKKALAGESEISKLSFYAYTNVTDVYKRQFFNTASISSIKSLSLLNRGTLC